MNCPEIFILSLFTLLFANCFFRREKVTKNLSKKSWTKNTKKLSAYDDGSSINKKIRIFKKKIGYFFGSLNQGDNRSCLQMQFVAVWNVSWKRWKVLEVFLMLHQLRWKDYSMATPHCNTMVMIYNCNWLALWCRLQKQLNYYERC